MTNSSLRIVFMGTPDFAVPSLQILVENNYNVVGVITAPDKPAGRGHKIQQSPVKKYAADKGLTILQPTNLKSEEFITELKALDANLQVVVAFRMLPEVIWKMPALGTFNLHGSLLPQYRGAAPINWAVINGDAESGVTTFFINENIDTGKIILQEKIKLSSTTTAGELHDQLMEVGKKLVLDTVYRIQTNNLSLLNQKDLLIKELKPAPKIFKETCKIDWHKDVQSVYNLIRGLSPYPAAWTTIKKDNEEILMKIFSAELSDKRIAPGTIESDNKTYLYIGCENGSLKITHLQLAGKNRMKTEDLLKGFNIGAYHIV
ncbi:MAG: methionyl-tRNA formyltransferase [Bacteroidetes bacterium]|nr:methionyl-tRNA formyltransferase [Bacteroidota bacterium]